MAAPHRYWRVKDISITPGSSFLEISEWHLYYGLTRVDASTTTGVFDRVNPAPV